MHGEAHVRHQHVQVRHSLEHEIREPGTNVPGIAPLAEAVVQDRLPVDLVEREDGTARLTGRVDLLVYIDGHDGRARVAGEGAVEEGADPQSLDVCADDVAEVGDATGEGEVLCAEELGGAGNHEVVEHHGGVGAGGRRKGVGGYWAESLSLGQGHVVGVELHGNLETREARLNLGVGLVEEVGIGRETLVRRPTLVLGGWYVRQTDLAVDTLW